MHQRPKYNSWAIKLLEGKIGQRLHVMGFENDLLVMTLKAQAIKQINLASWKYQTWTHQRLIWTQSNVIFANYTSEDKEVKFLDFRVHKNQQQNGKRI